MMRVEEMQTETRADLPVAARFYARWIGAVSRSCRSKRSRSHGVVGQGVVRERGVDARRFSVGMGAAMCWRQVQSR